MGIDGRSRKCYKNGIKRIDEYDEDNYYSITYYDENGNKKEAIKLDDNYEIINQQQDKINKTTYDYEEISYLRNAHLMLEEIIINGKIVKSIEYYKIMNLLKEDTMEYEHKLSKCIKSIDEIELSQR